jgi:methylglutaconyl-CoA hydratase
VTERPLVAALADGILSLTLNRPEKRNALSRALIEALHGELDRAELDGAVRAVALIGAGKDFCAGADLAELLASADRSPEENEADALRLGHLFLKLRQLPKPVVSLVRGNALAGGCGLATACDLVVASEDSRFGYPEIQRGFVPAMVLALLRRQVGERTAFDLVATGRIIGAPEAQRLGMISHVFPGERFDAGARDLLSGLVGGSATAFALTKRLLYELDGKTFEEGVRLGARVNALARATPDFRTRIQSFLNR